VRTTSVGLNSDLRAPSRLTKTSYRSRRGITSTGRNAELDASEFEAESHAAISQLLTDILPFDEGVVSSPSRLAGRLIEALEEYYPSLCQTDLEQIRNRRESSLETGSGGRSDTSGLSQAQVALSHAQTELSMFDNLDRLGLNNSGNGKISPPLPSKPALKKRKTECETELQRLMSPPDSSQKSTNSNARTPLMEKLFGGGTKR